MDRDAILRQLDRERRSLPRAGCVIDMLPDVTRLRAADGTHHTVIFSSLSHADVDAVIEREVAHHRALGAPFEWTAYAHDAPADLCERLRRRGFVIGPQEAVMVFDLAERPARVAQHDGDIPVQCVDDVDRLADFRRVAETAFGKDYAFTTAQLHDALRAGSTEHRAYVAYDPETNAPAGVGRLYTHPGSIFGGLYGGGTLPEFRGRGVYRATVAARARDAIAAGARYLQVDALPTSRPILERLGFQRVTDLWACEWRP